jgi:pantothenate kinase
MNKEKQVSPDELARIIFDRAQGKPRILVAIAGPPGAGKSTLSQMLAKALNAADPAEPAIVVPMDGFHYDNAVLEARGLLARKGAPETFDCNGFAALLARLLVARNVAIPIFDRSLDLARAGAAIVDEHHRILLVEGNYLLLHDAPWAGMESLFELTVRIEVAENELEKRLVQRWLDHGLDEESARHRALSNDIPNARLVAERSSSAEFVIKGQV